ncbi:RND transporter [Oleiphilus sp. HI0071]|uniref:efflux RND transporter permease subunit n=1 Tax=unclassified Oleiphilus TaxID=2631174 RepID=UPI0007C33CE9|nr:MULTISPECIES: MMPL family transporter [unclassified Oleiphilus]KZY60102.1 RND transporter [Oleiphilus sp. HI0065]KZY84307.1 RND transporter [Oleiphilus sp. HI0071]KZZ02409.1 RND transporter [Oleiphilus sp. HI0073]KZZ44838.1 RND transporter [Oleiphilus sp. HI0118]KZZ50285.1 RND transporter [Oleiphilus sp. HI0122]KZZ78070.1 RND transporter [Oleiphilus sp. HI0130]KZZ78916.1 RND transporter [Oleiphilus sp. HI0133]
MANADQSSAGTSAKGSGSVAERLIFENRPVILGLFLLITAFLGFNAAQIKPDASFERLIPLEHEFIQNMMDNRSDLENLGNFIRIAVAVEEGDIFNQAYMQTLSELSDEVFKLSGVDQAAVQSLWTPNVRWVEVTEDGFQGGTVIPDDYDGTESSLNQLRENILKSGQVGRLVADNFKSTIIYAPLLDIDPETKLPLDYADFSKKLEDKIRAQYEEKNPNVSIHIVGFAKKVGDLIEGIGAIATFALVTIGLTLSFLFIYSRCAIATTVPIVTSIVAVVWQLGLLNIFGYGLDPYSVLIPFLVFAIGISHGVQIVNQIAVQRASGLNALMSARMAFRNLARPGILALVSDAIGFLTLFFIEIEVIRDLAVAAGVGVAVIIITNLVLHPVLMSYTGLSKGGLKHAKKVEMSEHKPWRVLSFMSHQSVAPISIVIAILGCVIGLYYQKDLKIGDLDRGAPELRPDSRYNLDNAFIIDNYSTSADVLVVMIKTEPQMCSSYELLDVMDRMQWQLENTEGVQSTVSLVTVSKLVTKALNEGSFKWFELSPDQQFLDSTLQRAPAGLINTNCSLTPMIVYLDDHKAETLNRVVDEMKSLIEAYPSEDYTFLLAAGNAGVEAATNEVIEKAKTVMLLSVYAVVSFLCLVTFRSIAAVICIITPLALTSVLCEALMAQLGIGVKVATLPVIALGVGIGVDYGIYIYSQLEAKLKEGMTLQDAYFETLKTTGKAVAFTGVTLGIGVCTWIFSPIKFQADMGILLFFMFLWNMIGSMWLLPALARFLVKPKKAA